MSETKSSAFSLRISALPIAKDGGREDASKDFMKDGERINPLTSPVRMLGLSGQILGSGVLVWPNWVLTAAHVLASRPKVVRADQGHNTAPVRVVQIIWKSGASMDDGEGDWPEGVENFRGEADELVLLRLETGSLSTSGLADHAVLPLLEHGELQPMEKLALAGFGVDSAGNYADKVRIIRLRCVGSIYSSRGVAIADLGDPDGALPRRDDSGAPIFRPDLLPDDPQLLCGIHVSRTHAKFCSRLNVVLPEYEIVSKYLPVGVEETDWIQQHIKPSSKVVNSVETKPNFILRRRFHCHSMATPFDLASPKRRWKMTAVCSNSGVLKDCDEVHILRSPAGAMLRIHRCGSSSVEREVLLTAGETNHKPQGILWLYGRDTRDGTDFYVFRRSDCRVQSESGDGSWVLRRRIRIEVFVKNSTHVRPSIHNVEGENVTDGPDEPSLPRCVCADSGAPMPAVFGDDQDDEGEGYED
jgi:hypothetical protein